MPPLPAAVAANWLPIEEVAGIVVVFEHSKRREKIMNTKLGMGRDAFITNFLIYYCDNVLYSSTDVVKKSLSCCSSSKGKCSGSGVYYYNMNGRYEGDWVDQKYDGYGVETSAKGSRYRGQYRQGLRHGYGVYRFYTGDMYAGEWIKGQCHGNGVHTCEDGSKYFGEFKGGVKHGSGHYYFT
ncbi:hypothetical protein L6452_24072 [Arctium lappa]|uniref:Uncharacterized protein n=1 Tax=Arctium lappa TaxID=4217 RepID=A0ACB9A959_ARCLA|nr:hypothetical protein L6452_24072 [Arctium lappa]